MSYFWVLASKNLLSLPTKAIHFDLNLVKVYITLSAGLINSDSQINKLKNILIKWGIEKCYFKDEF